MNTNNDLMSTPPEKRPKHKAEYLFTEDGRRFYPTGLITPDGRKLAGNYDGPGRGRTFWMGKRYLFWEDDPNRPR